MRGKSLGRRNIVPVQSTRARPGTRKQNRCSRSKKPSQGGRFTNFLLPPRIVAIARNERSQDILRCVLGDRSCGTVGKRRQKDTDGDVKTDTLILKHFADATQLRVTLGGTNGEVPTLKFLGFCFCNTKVLPPAGTPDRAAWGKIIPTPEISQNAYAKEDGWCSPTSLSMVLQRWSNVLGRPEMHVDVPQTAASVYDRSYKGTGNWPFNTAYAGSFPGMRAYITRFNDISELEAWVDAGIPVIISAPWHLLEPGRPNTGAGHLTVCIGFTKDGDVVDNDPGTNPKKRVQHIYNRKNVIKAWAQSHNTVYLVYPVGANLPDNTLGQW